MDEPNLVGTPGAEAFHPQTPVSIRVTIYYDSQLKNFLLLNEGFFLS
jgi:hypothetical protein